MTKPLVILGAGGHASVLVDILRQQNRELVGLVSPDFDSSRRVLAGIKRYTSDEDVLLFDRGEFFLINGLGSLPGDSLRANIYERFSSLDFVFDTIVSSNAMVSPYAELGPGVQIMAGAIVQAGSVIGENTIINTGAIVEHDCVIGANNHIAPGVSLSGQVKTGDFVHIGTGANIVQSISIGEKSVVSVGASITRDIPNNQIAFGGRNQLLKAKE